MGIGFSGDSVLDVLRNLKNDLDLSEHVGKTPLHLLVHHYVS